MNFDDFSNKIFNILMIIKFLIILQVIFKRSEMNIEFRIDDSFENIKYDLYMRNYENILYD